MLGLLPLLLCALLAAANPLKHARAELSQNSGLDQKDYLVTKLPGLAKNIPLDKMPLMFAGQLPLYEQNRTHYFFWKFAAGGGNSETVRVDNRTIFWLNGGPGCSSMDGALMEAGPFRVNSKNEVTYNEGSWHEKGDIVFVDQPAGTGFSYSEEFDAELPEIAWHFLTFLEKYFALFPEDIGNDILLAGESYAGQYIPYIARAIIDRNLRLGGENASAEESAKQYNLKGLLIGNGYISPNEQGLSFIPFAVENGMITHDHPNFANLLNAHESCQRAVDHTNIENTSGAFAVVDRTCDEVLTLLLKYTLDRSASRDAQCFNMYDYTLKDSYPSCGMNWPPDLTNVNPFLGKEEVMADLNLVYHKKWTECSGPVGSHFKAKKSLPAVHLLPDLLAEVPIVLFHGNRDVICNYIGAEMMIKKLDWGGHSGFTDDAVTYEWRHNGSVEGSVRTERNLTYVNVFNASHMVPFDKPEASRALVDLVYRHYELKTEEAQAPELLTYPVGYKAAEAVEAVETTSELDAPSNSTISVGELTDNPGAVNGTEPGASKGNSEVPTSPIVRVIQLAVIVVLIWGVCALYNTYKAKPTSIIKTKPAAAGRKKNVSWADQLEETARDLGVTKPPSLLSKAMNTFKKPDGKGTYQHVDNDIEMNEGVPHGDDFIIASDEEEEEPESRSHGK